VTALAHWLVVHREFVDGVGIDALMGLSVWIVLACGRLSLCNYLFAFVGALVTIDLASIEHWPIVFAAVAGALSAALCGLLLGLVLAPVARVPFAVATFALGLMAQYFLAPTKFGGIAHTVPPASIYIVLLFVTAVVWLFTKSRTGLASAAAALDERAAASLGYNVERLRLIALTKGAFVAGIAGSLIALHRGSFDPADFGFDQNVRALAAVVVGGTGSFIGPLLGAALLGAIPLAVPSIASSRAILDAALLLAFSIALPGGLASLLVKVWRR
jgi:branched-chain amino acid transport system permease protein